MYLEISPRRTGKTNRLMAAMMVSLHNGFTPVLMAPNRVVREMILKQMDKDIARQIKTITSKDGWVMLTNHSRTPDKYRLFVDEFDYFKSKEIVYQSDNGYYCTTPVKVRKMKDVIAWKMGETQDSLLTLLEMNMWHYETRSNIPSLMKLSVDDMAKRLYNYPHSEDYDAEMRGIWLER